MMALEPVRVAEALRNLSVTRTQYGRVTSIVRRYRIPRATLYRMEARFLEEICHQREGRAENPYAKELDRLMAQVASLEQDNANLRAQVEQLQSDSHRALVKCRFWLIGLGLPARVIARLLRECFGVYANRTDILRLTAQYARRATGLMQVYFWPLAQDADLDEVFIEHLPLLIASEPRALAILKTSLEEDRTVAKWSAFLDDLPHLRRTTSDRGQAIRGAIARNGHIEFHQSDIFHPKMLLHDELRIMEARCYSLMEREAHLQHIVDRTKRRGRDCRAAAVRLYKVAEQTRQAIALFDELEAAVHLAFDALRITTDAGTFNSPATAREDLQFAKAWIHEHLPSGWAKVKHALDDDALLTFLNELQSALSTLPVHSPTREDHQYVLVTLARLWEDQAQRRHRGKPVLIPTPIEEQLQNLCGNLADVKRLLFDVLDHLHASSGIECINSRVGFYRYSKRRFSADFANLIAVWHNLSPFEDGKRAGQSPAQILNIKLPSYDLFELFNVA
jgi:hypothetical protein